jgi:DNA-binding response OmpR family regulator
MTPMSEKSRVTGPPEEVRERPARLLVVDDEPAVLRLMEAILKRNEFQVRSCDSAGQALRLVQNEPFDCVITDALMPVMSGYDLVRAIRRQPDFSALPVLMLTRKRHPDDVKKAIEIGVSDYVLKPIDEVLLLNKLELCLSKGEGRRHIYEVPIQGTHSQAQLQLDAAITSLSESDVTIRLAVPLESSTAFKLAGRFFQDIGIAVPHLKLIRCVELESPTELADLRYEARLTFAGVPESDLRKLRTFIQKEVIRRRK